MQMVRKVASWVRRRRWLLLVVLIVGFVALPNHKPQWYLDEAAVMEQVADLLDSPVPYGRDGPGWSSALHVSSVVLPRVKLDEDRTLQLAGLLRRLPKGILVICHYVRHQKDGVERLKRVLAGHASVFFDLGVSSEDIETLRHHVAGLYN